MILSYRARYAYNGYASKTQDQRVYAPTRIISRFVDRPESTGSEKPFWGEIANKRETVNGWFRSILVHGYSATLYTPVSHSKDIACLAVSKARQVRGKFTQIYLQRKTYFVYVLC